ncbi:MAG: site-2 protease family protein [Thermoprotei archaeon]|nr:MAG: site-2 protease family protein [Thermoprotei archaeon]
MENTSYYPSQECYPPIISDTLRLLLRAGRSVLRVGVYKHGLGKVYDLVLDAPLGEEVFNSLYKQLVEKYRYFPLQLSSGNPVLRLVPIRGRGWKQLKLVLLIATIATVLLTGYSISEGFYSTLGMESDLLTTLELSIVYTGAFLVALGIHEYGHIAVSRGSGVVIEGPYFIPAPPIQLGFIGTLGAVINMKTLPPSKKALARLGLAGPLAGYVIALAIGVIGVFLSPIIELSEVYQLVSEGRVVELDILPVTVYILIALRGVPPGYTILLHPLFFASFIVLIVTFLNLMPIGQLDGGHVLRSYVSSKKYEYIGYSVITVMLAAGLVLRSGAGLYYSLLAVVLLILKLVLGLKPHPGSANQYSTMRDYKYLILYLVLVALTIPIPVV